MTLGTTHSIVSYNGDGTMERFDVTFEFHAASDLEVILVTVASGVEQVQTQGFDYEVTGGNGGTGQIHFRIVVPAATERVVIRRVSPDIQPDDLVDGGALAAEPLERRLDIIAARLQELETDIARSLKVVKGSQATILDLNLVGGKNRQLTVASDEQGVIIATGTLPGAVQTSQFGEDWINLSGPVAGRMELGLGTAALETIGISGASVPLLNGNNNYSGTSVFTGDASFGSDVVIGAPFVLTSETLAIDGNGQIAPTRSHVLLSNAGSLGAISVINHPAGAIIELRPGPAGQWPTLLHQAPGSGNIFLSGGVSAALDAMDKTIWLQRRNDAGQSPGWYEIGRTWHAPIVQVSHFQHTEPTGTIGQSGLITSSWSTGTLNTIVRNDIAEAELVDNVVRLPSGSYEFWSDVGPVDRCGNFRFRLFDTSTSSLLGMSVANSINMTTPGGVVDHHPQVSFGGSFDLSANSNIERQYYVGSSGFLGSPAMNVLNELEVYANLYIRKTA